MEVSGLQEETTRKTGELHTQTIEVGFEPPVLKA